MKFLIGSIITLAGLCSGMYFGLYLCFYGGLVAGFDAIQSGNGPDFACAVLRFICTGPLTAILGWIPVILGLAIMGGSTKASFTIHKR